MKLIVDQITESPKEIRFSEELGELNRLADSEGSRDFRFPPAVEVAGTYYRAGREIFIRGELAALVDGRCSRCLKRYGFPLEKKFDLVLTPAPPPAKGKELSADELGLSYYTSKEIDLSPLVREQVLLALPMRPLCGEDCRGLCAGCGVDLNSERCLCPVSAGDPRMAVFRTLKVGPP